MENNVVDALNSRVNYMHATSIIMYKSDLKDEILEATKSDLHYIETKEILQKHNSQ